MSALRAGARQPVLGRGPRPDGSFEIEGVPPGSWVLKAWHERSARRSSRSRCPRRVRLEVSLTLDASKWKRAPHKNKFGKDYESGERY